MERATVLVFSLCLLHKTHAAELQTISDSTFLGDGDTLVSPAGIFELGFFKPGSSGNRYLGIWYKKISVRTVVWVANRDRPIPAASSPLLLKIVNLRTLGLFYNTTMIWSSNTTTTWTTITKRIINATAKLLDTGNLVVTDRRENFLWQSFDYPTDTLLSGMKLGRDYVRRKEWHLTSWKSNQDPAPGELTWGPDAVGYPECKLKRHGNSILFRDGPWRNQRFTAISAHNKNLTSFTYEVIVNESEVFFAYNVDNIYFLTRVTLNSSGHLESWAWVEEGRGWQRSVSFPRDTCDRYNTCNAYAICNLDAIRQYCTCLDEKFVPKNQKGWETNDWSGGCVKRTPLECENGSDGFVKYSYVKLPDTRVRGLT